MSKIQEVIVNLRKLYPNLEIIGWVKNNRGQLIINSKVIFRYDPDYIEKSLNKFGVDGFNETVKIWAEYIETRYIQRINKFDKKPNGRPGLCLTTSQIKFAMSNSRSNSAAARFLHVSLNTYRKYAKMHGLYDQHKNPSAKGIPKGGAVKKVPFEDIFANKHPNYNKQHLKNRLISEMVFEEKCNVCGYQERRSFDGKVGLLLDFVDGNKKNMSKTNMRLICFNCTFNLRGRLSAKVLEKLDKQHKENIEYTDDKKVQGVWDELNPEKEKPYEPDIIQTNVEQVEDIWKKFNR